MEPFEPKVSNIYLSPNFVETQRGKGIKNNVLADFIGKNIPEMQPEIQVVRQKYGKNNDKAVGSYLDWKIYGTSNPSQRFTVQSEQNTQTENPFNPFRSNQQGALPQEGSPLGNIAESWKKRGEAMGDLTQEISRQEGGLSMGNVPELAFNLTGQAIGAAGDVVGEAMSPLIKPVVKSVQDSQGFLGPVAKTAMEGVDPLVDWFNAYKAENPRKAAALGSAANIASVLPIEKVFTGFGSAAKQAGKTISNVVQESAEQVAKKVPSMPKINPLAAVKSDRVADRLFQTALDLNSNQIVNISKPNVAGKNPFTWMRERGIIGTRSEVMPQLDELAKTARNTKLELLSGVQGRTVMKSSDQALDEILKQVAPDGIPRAGLEDIANKAALLRSLPDRTLLQHEQVKSLMDDVLKMYGKTSDGVDNLRAEGWRNIRDDLKTFIENKALESGVPDIKRLNKDIQVSRAIVNALQKTGATQPYTKLIPVIRSLGGAGGAGALGFVAAGPVGAFAGVAMERLFTNPKVQTLMAKMLARYSDNEIEAVKAMLKNGKGSPAARKVMNEISEDLSEVLRKVDIDRTPSVPISEDDLPLSSFSPQGLKDAAKMDELVKGGMTAPEAAKSLNSPN